MHSHPSFRAPGAAGLRSRKSMLETLVKHLAMVRLTVPAIAMLCMAACTGLIDGNGGLTPEQAAARKAFINSALPRFNEACTVCHAGARVGVEFLQGASPGAQYTQIMGFDPQVVNTDAPGSSRVLTKGLHEGPELLSEQASDILQWINLEKAAIPDPGGDGGPILETAEFQAQICTDASTPGSPTCPINSVSLDNVGIAGAKINFVAQAFGSALYVTELRLVPGAGGANIEHPLFVSWPADGSAPKPDTLDRFFNVKLNLMATATQDEELIGGGLAAFVGFVASDKITIHFRVAGLFKTDDGGGGTTEAAGCKRLDSFKTNAQSSFAAAVAGAPQSCISCHNAGNAQSAVNMVGVNAGDDVAIKAACDQIRTRVDFQNTAQSGIYLAPDPANANHPFKFNTAQLSTFKAAVDKWIADEKVAP